MSHNYPVPLPSMNRLILALIFITPLPAAADTTLEGLCGAKLKEAIKLNHSPSNRQTDIEQHIPTLFSINIFTGEQPAAIHATQILPSDWWKNIKCDIDKDLFNYISGDITVTSLKKEYPPGTVTKPTYSNGIWSTGTGTIDGITVNFYSPPTGFEGDFARAIYYLLSVYPNDRWSGLAVNFCCDGDFPGLHPWSYRQLAAWNETDPVDSEESLRNEKIASIQGNRNPFIDYPELAEHIWGEKSEIPFNKAITKPGTEAPAPLRPSYRITDDAINLTSPHIPSDARLTINGQPIETRSISPASLGTGVHELRFENGMKRGKILIEITP